MKRNIANLVSLIVLGATSLMSACSGELFDAPIVEEMVDGSHWERADINLNVHRVNFDAQAGATRSVDEGWKDGDRIYLILKDKDGNNVQAYIEYDAAAASWGQVEYNTSKMYLTCTTPRTIEAYFFDGIVNVTTSDITFDATTGVYACKDGIYIYPSDGDLEVSISLVPLTSRIRFTGESGTNFSLSGITTHTAFSRTTGALTTTSSNVSTSVDDTGTTPYIYGVFTNPERPTLGVVNSSKDMFVTEFEASTHVLQVGHSGYLTVPTEDSHRGWKLKYSATSISLDKNSLNLPKGEVATLNATLTPADTKSKVVWSSSDPSVATVSDAGVVTAIGFGTAIITAAADDNPDVKATCSIDIKTITYQGWDSSNKGPNSTSSKTYTIDADSGDVLTFYWEVNSESGGDWLIVTLDGSQILKKSGEDCGYYEYTFTSSGNHKLIVKYTVDGSFEDIWDYAYIDDVILTKNS